LSGAPRTLTTGLFGEAAINLTAAAVFAPQPISLSNCGTIRIRKVIENGDATFGYTGQRQRQGHVLHHQHVVHRQR
jgi:hypothetical protein